VEEYHKLIDNGMISENDRVELLHGWITAKMGINPPHNTAVNRLMKAFLAISGPDGVVRVQQPITTEDSEPEPDVVLAAGTDADYQERNPGPAEVIVLVEVADASLREDQTTKLRLYAAAGIYVYWIVNLIARRVEVYTQPRGGRNPSYKQQKQYKPGEDVPIIVRRKQLGRIPVKELLP
jgi:Uma2 family endonuclease